MKKEDVIKAPKMFCEQIKIGRTPEYFVFALTSGNQAQFHTLTPGHTKRLLQYLTHEVAEYEKENGDIDAQWDPNIISPVQQRRDPQEGS